MWPNVRDAGQPATPIVPVAGGPPATAVPQLREESYEGDYRASTVTFHGVITRGQARPVSGRQRLCAVMVAVPLCSAWKAADASPFGAVRPAIRRSTVESQDAGVLQVQVSPFSR